MSISVSNSSSDGTFSSAASFWFGVKKDFSAVPISPCEAILLFAEDTLKNIVWTIWKLKDWKYLKQKSKILRMLFHCYLKMNKEIHCKNPITSLIKIREW